MIQVFKQYEALLESWYDLVNIMFCFNFEGHLKMQHIFE